MDEPAEGRTGAGSRSEYARLLAENERYTESFDRSALTAAPLSGLAIIACMDARLDVEEALGLRTGRRAHHPQRGRDRDRRRHPLDHRQPAAPGHRRDRRDRAHGMRSARRGRGRAPRAPGGGNGHDDQISRSGRSGTSRRPSAGRWTACVRTRGSGPRASTVSSSTSRPAGFTRSADRDGSRMWRSAADLPPFRQPSLAVVSRP